MLHLAIFSPVFVPYQGGGTPLDSDLDQGAGEEAKAWQVEPGGDGGVVETGPKFCSLSLSALQS